MLIKCPHCKKTNRLSVEKLSNKPICGVCHHSFFSLPIEVNQDSFDELISQKNMPILVDFWAPWCGPCKSFASTFSLGAQKNGAEVIHAKVNTEEETIIASKYNIQSIPTLIGFAQGKELVRLSGALSIDQLQDLTNKVIHASF